jgi:hypothetical protein
MSLCSHFLHEEQEILLSLFPPHCSSLNKFTVTFTKINKQIFGHDYELKDFSLQELA